MKKAAPDVDRGPHAPAARRRASPLVICLVYAEITEQQTSNASSIATMQQMSVSFGVAAAAGLATAFFIQAPQHSKPGEMIHGIHEALVALGVFTILSTIIFAKLKSGDGDDVSQHKVLPA